VGRWGRPVSWVADFRESASRGAAAASREAAAASREASVASREAVVASREAAARAQVVCPWPPTSLMRGMRAPVSHHCLAVSRIAISR
jgi:hypothetical protein